MAERRPAGVLCDMRRHVERAHIGHERSCVIALVAAEREDAGNDGGAVRIAADGDAAAGAADDRSDRLAGEQAQTRTVPAARVTKPLSGIEVPSTLSLPELIVVPPVNALVCWMLNVRTP